MIAAMIMVVRGRDDALKPSAVVSVEIFVAVLDAVEDDVENTSFSETDAVVAGVVIDTLTVVEDTSVTDTSVTDTSVADAVLVVVDNFAESDVTAVGVVVDTSVDVEDTFAIVLTNTCVGVGGIVEELSVDVVVVVAVVEMFTRPGLQSEFDSTLKNSTSPRCTQLEPGESLNRNTSIWEV